MGYLIIAREVSKKRHFRAKTIKHSVKMHYLFKKPKIKA